MQQPTCTLIIDISKICHNYRLLQSICNKAQIAAAVKANAYGLGVDKIAPALQYYGCQNFFVASVEEGISLRQTLNLDTLNQTVSSNIFVLHGVFENTIHDLQAYCLIPVLNNLHQLHIWQKHAIKTNKVLPCTIHIDTGMHRLGMSDQECEMFISNFDELNKGIDILYIMSHLSTSETIEHSYNKQQLKKFQNYLARLPKNIKASFSNSGGVFLGKSYHFDLVRAGIALYGCNLNVENPQIMHNPITLTAPIIHIQNLSKGQHIGYNMQYTTSRNSVIATLPIGYADGYFRAFSNKAKVFIDGHFASVVGRVSMDLVTIDVTDIPNDKIFLMQQVEIIGDNCTIDQITATTDTVSSYELLTHIVSNRYNIVYKQII